MPSKEPLFRFVLNHSLELILRYDSYGCIRYANDRVTELTGYTQDELLGRFIGYLFKEVYQIIDNHVVLTEQYRDKQIIETVMYRKNKTCFPIIMTTASVIFDDEATFFCMLVDMTSYKENLRKLEDRTQEVKRSIEARDSFVANVTHELRTPVNGIKGSTELLMEQESDLAKLSTLKLILDSCRTMEGIINNILDFSKLEAGKFELDEKPFSFGDFMQRMERQFAALTMRKGLRMSVNVAEDIPDRLIGDELRITQILNNLVSNAVKFTEQGYVGVEVTKNRDIEDEVELFFVVSDTGIGISMEDKDKLFQSFSQVDASITRRYGGTGLGLSITKDLIDMMHGDIWAEGEKGKGSTFSFTLHLKKAELAPETEKEENSSQKHEITIKYAPADKRDKSCEFRSEANAAELRSNFEKLNLSADMDNWYKAEGYAAVIKKLLSGGSKQLQKQAFRMEMAVRKADYDKFRAYADELKLLMREEWYRGAADGEN